MQNKKFFLLVHLVSWVIYISLKNLNFFALFFVEKMRGFFHPVSTLQPGLPVVV